MKTLYNAAFTSSRRTSRLLLPLLLFVFTSLVSVNASGSPLISVSELQQKMGQENLVVLETQPAKYYQQAHLPGSVQTSYDDWRTTNADGVREMLPAQDVLQALIGSLGIDNDSEVVIVPVGRGAGDMAVATRIYWTLYVAGLDRLSILDGGLLGYYNALGGSALVAGPTKPQARTFKIKLREADIPDIEQVAAYLERGDNIVDARSPQEFAGKMAGQGERPGRMPGAVNLPYDSLMNAKQDGLASSDELRERFEKAGVALEGEQLVYCHSGHRASLVWFVSHEVLGNQSARMYDGSMIEWAATSDRPLVTD